MVDSEETKRQ